jgi:hypothetical protein
MAELSIKIGNAVGDGTYKDGDILCAFNSRRIRCTHAQHICHIKNAGFTAEGLRPNDCLAEKMLQRTRQFRCQRVSRTVVERLNLLTMEVETLSGTPNAKGEYMHVPTFVEHRLAHPRHDLFGSPGREVWYGGRTYYGNDKMTLVWNDIETHSAFREVDHLHWPIPQESGPKDITLALSGDVRRYLIHTLGRSEPFDMQYFAADRSYRTAREGSVVSAILGGESARVHLYYPCDDMTDARAEELVSSVFSEEKATDKMGKEVAIDGLDDPKIKELGLQAVMVAKRSHHLEWRNLPGVQEADVLDDTKRVVMRDSVGPIATESVVNAKSGVG